MSTLQITRKMASVRESISDVFVNLSDQLGSLVLKEEQKLAVEALSRKICNGRSSRWFRESFDFANTASIVVVVPFRSIFQDQLQSKDFGLKAVAFKKIPQLLKDIRANKYNVIFASARNKLCRQNSPQDALK